MDVRERELQAMREHGRVEQAQRRAVGTDLRMPTTLARWPELSIGTDDALLASLDGKPLSAWETETVAVPTRMRQAARTGRQTAGAQGRARAAQVDDAARRGRGRRLSGRVAE